MGVEALVSAAAAVGVRIARAVAAASPGGRWAIGRQPAGGGIAAATCANCGTPSPLARS